jgi:transposase
VIGRSRGGLTTKIHALVDALGNPVDLMLAPGRAHELADAEPLIDSAHPEALTGGEAYDADPLIDTLTKRGIAPVIRPKANRKNPRACDFALHCERNLAERFFNKLKHFRAIAPRYAKPAKKFLAGVHLTSAIILLNLTQPLVYRLERCGLMSSLASQDERKTIRYNLEVPSLELLLALELVNMRLFRPVMCQNRRIAR